MADMSKNVEMTSGYSNLYWMSSGKMFLEFDASGGSSERVLCKDPTSGSQTGNCFYIETFDMFCQSGNVNIYDGSAGVKLFQVLCPANVDASRGNRFWSKDFRPDALKCLTADNTQSLCISAANGFWTGHLTGWFGVA